MSSNTYAAPLRLEFAPSRRRVLWRRLTHGAAAATLPILPSPWLAVAVAALVLLSWYRSRAEPALTLLAHAEGQWTLFEADRVSEAVCAGAPFVQPWLIILPLRIGGRRRVRRIAVFPDMLPAREFRRLRVRLATEHGRGPEAPG